MSKRERCARYLFFIAGLFVNAFGISMIIKANLGEFTLLLKIDFRKEQFLQIPVAILFSFFYRRLGFINKIITFAPNKTPIQPYEDNRNQRTHPD